MTWITAEAFDILATTTAEAAREAIDAGTQSGSAAAVACVLNCTGRWTTYPTVPKRLTDEANRVLMGCRGDWRGVTLAVLHAEGIKVLPTVQPKTELN